MTIKPINNNVAIILDEPEKMHGLIALPNNATMSKNNTGKVVATGPGTNCRRLDDSVKFELIPCSVKVGDRVLIATGYHCEDPIIVDERKMIVIGDNCILAIIEE